MPALAPNSLVLVTGGSGFLGAHCVKELLERGHSVRTTVRSSQKGDYLKQLFKRHGEKFSYVIADDVEKKGVFDEAVKGVDGVLHTASPFHFNAAGAALDKLVNPAVNGTNNVLNSIVKEKSIKRVVITSSFAAILDRNAPGHADGTKVYTEKDYNTSDPEESAKVGNEQAPGNAYRASKSLAEKAAWDFHAAHQPAWDVSTVNPPLIPLGPIIHQCDSPEKLNTSSAAIWALLNGKKSEGELAQPSGNFVDVRDVAKVHADCLMQAVAGGERFAPSAGPFTMQDIADVIHSTSTPLPDAWKKGTPVGTKGAGAAVKQLVLDGSKCEKELGLKYHCLKDCIQGSLDSFQDYEKRNWKGVTSEDIVYLP